MPEHVHNKFCHGLDCMDEEPGPTLDELVAAVLDALSEADLRAVAMEIRPGKPYRHTEQERLWLGISDRLEAAADALHALEVG